MVQLAKSWATIDWGITVQIFIPPITALAAAVALFLNWIATKNNSKTRELDIFYKVFQRIQDLQDKYFRDYAKMQEEDKVNWLSIFYNEIECIAFLINTKHLKGDFKDFYSESFVTSYEKIFLVKADPKVVEDPIQYPEIKKLYKKLKPQNDHLSGIGPKLGAKR